MRGGTKILAIVTIIIILVSIGFSGCVEEEKDKDDREKNATSNDLKLKINLLNGINNTSVDVLQVDCRLINVNSESIKVVDYLRIGDNIYGYINNSFKDTYYVVYGTKGLEYGKRTFTVLNPNEYIETIVTIEKWIYESAGCNINGTLKLQLYYTDVSPYRYSNQLSFRFN